MTEQLDTSAADTLMQRAIGRAKFCRDRGEVKTPEILDALSAELTALRASEATAIDRVKRLTDFISEFAEYKFDVLGSAYHVSPEDETDDYTDLGPVLTWQKDAVSILATTKGKPMTAPNIHTKHVAQSVASMVQEWFARFDVPHMTVDLFEKRITRFQDDRDNALIAATFKAAWIAARDVICSKDWTDCDGDVFCDAIKNAIEALTPPDAQAALQAMIDAAVKEAREKDAAKLGRVMHQKRGSFYRILGRGKVQTDKPLSDYAEVAVYQCEEDGAIWVRPVTEFDDGRFAKIGGAS